MELANHQRILLGLIRSNYQVRNDDDAYFHRVSQSRDLEEARGNIFLWRVWVLERTCVLTVRLLRQRNLLKKELDFFISRHNISPFRESQGPDFLEALVDHEDDLVASVAQFERALIKVKLGDQSSYIVSFPVEPKALLNGLARNLPIEMVARGSYEVTVSSEIPGLFRIECEGKQ